MLGCYKVKDRFSSLMQLMIFGRLEGNKAGLLEELSTAGGNQ